MWKTINQTFTILNFHHQVSGRMRLGEGRRWLEFLRAGAVEKSFSLWKISFSWVSMILFSLITGYNSELWHWLWRFVQNVVFNDSHILKVDHNRILQRSKVILSLEHTKLPKVVKKQTVMTLKQNFHKLHNSFLNFLHKTQNFSSSNFKLLLPQTSF